MDRLELSDLRGLRLESVSVPAPELAPEAVLHRDPGSVRGFWARGERWVAHLGEVFRIEAGEGEGEGGDRVRRVREGAEGAFRLAREALGEGAPSPSPPRMYGGFAFRDRPRRRGQWRAFPPALFVLPALEVVGDADGTWITLRRRVGGEGRAEWGELRARLEAEVEELVEAFERREGDGPPRGSGREGLPASLREGSRKRWTGAVQEAIREIEGGRVRKVVLARTLDVGGERRLDPVDVVMALWRENPGTHVFLFEPEAGACVVGAAPETVATVTDGIFRATAVAGSIGRGESPEEQEALALRLLESGKDRVEHGIAVDDMVSRLRPLCEELTWDSEPHVLTLARIQHLESRIRGRLRAGEDVLSALASLHPTPAVCGLPRDAALEFLRVEEPFERGWYAGPVGWFDEDGNGVFAPALRCAVSGRGRWRLFAGAGIVPESDPALEWEETRIKFLPALRALEAAGARGVVAALEASRRGPSGEERATGAGGSP